MANTFKFGNGQWAVGKETALAYNDENGNFKPLPFDFTRASSATVVNKDGLIETVGTDEPRIDFLNNTKGHLLLEPSRQNKITHSIPNSNWATENGASITENYSVSPDGSQNASRVQIPSGSLARIHRQFTVDANEDSISFYIKSNTGSNFNVAFYLRDAGFGTVRYFNTNLEVTNEWQRVKIENQDLSAASVQVMVLFYNTAGSGSAWDFSLWGVQAEGGSYATSYIPTSGSTATRSAEFCRTAGNDTVINKTQGVLFAEIAALADDLTFRQITLNDGSLNTILIGYRTNSNRIYAQLINNNVSQAFISYDVADITEFHKVALVYENNRVDLWIDGVKRASDTSATMPLNLTNIELEGTSGSGQFYAKTKQIKIYNTALSDSELQALTS